MKEIGMLFSTDMVTAILLGQKTCTRRLIKLKDLHRNPNNDPWYRDYLWSWRCHTGMWTDHTEKQLFEKAPVHVNDKIYVRETWQETYDRKTDSWKPIYFAGNENKIWIEDDGRMKWKPSLHMPKNYARIWLEVTDVSIEKISDITEEESIKEGFSSKESFDIYWKNRYNEFDKYVWVIHFRRLDNE
jgi:hypothetical protein